MEDLVGSKLPQIAIRERELQRQIEQFKNECNDRLSGVLQEIEQIRADLPGRLLKQRRTAIDEAKKEIELEVSSRLDRAREKELQFQRAAEAVEEEVVSELVEQLAGKRPDCYQHSEDRL